MSNNEEVFLRIKINNENPIGLNTLTASLNAFSSQYKSFLSKQNQKNKTKVEKELLVKEVSKGSFIIDLISQGDIVPLFASCNTVAEFSQSLKSIFDYFLKSTKDSKKPDLTTKDISDFWDMVEPAAKEPQASMNITIMQPINGNNNVINNYYINNERANDLQGGDERIY